MIASPFNFASVHRLLAAAEFSAVFANRRALRGVHFELLLRRDTAGGYGGARLGLVIAKKFARRAVQRNLVKRIGREAFRQARPELPTCDLVLRLSKSLPMADRAARRAWRAEIDGLLARLRGDPS